MNQLQEIQEILEYRLPPFTYIVGPRQSGKTTLAKNLLRYHGFDKEDVLWITDSSTPRAWVDTWLNNMPVGKKKIMVIDVDMPDGLRERLLAWVEDQPEDFYILALGTSAHMDVIVSRAEVFSLPPGPVAGAEASPEVKGVVLALLRAFESRDGRALDEVGARWQYEHSQLLLLWCQEKITKKFSIFTGREVSVPEDLPINLLKSMVSGARPRFLVRGPFRELLRSME